MASALTIDISATRAITATGRLVAGETASISIVGASPAKLYLINAQRDVIAYCDAFEAAQQGNGGNGTINLATTQIADIVANIPAGRAFSVSCLIEDDGGDVVGVGYVPLVSAPMPDELVDFDIDFYLRASQVGAGLAVVGGKLVCTISPETYLTKAEAEETYAKKCDLPSGYVTQVNGQTPDENGAVNITASDIDYGEQLLSVAIANLQTGKANAADLRYALGEALIPDPTTGAYQLSDRAVNLIATDSESIDLVFPTATADRARDFFVIVESQSTQTGNVSLGLDADYNILAPGGNLPDIPLGGYTVLYFTEVGQGVSTCDFMMKGETLTQVEQGGN